MLYSESAVLDEIDVSVQRTKRAAQEKRNKELESIREAALAKIMNKTMAPTVSKKYRNKSGFDMDDYKYNKPAGTQPASQPAAPVDSDDFDVAYQCALNRVLSEFLEDKYAKDYFYKCQINKALFLQFYLINIAQADVLTSWLYENLPTLEIEPRTIFNYFYTIGIQWTGLKDRGPKYSTYKTMIYFLKAFGDEFYVNRISRGQWRDHSDTENLWSYFCAWFIKNILAPLLVKVKCQFIEKSVHKSDKIYETFYKPSADEFDDALVILHKWELAQHAAAADKPKEGKDADESKAGFVGSTAAGGLTDADYD